MIDAPEILRALNLFFAPGDVFEIRALAASVPSYRHEHPESGYFDYEHIKDVPKALENITARGIYFTPNPVNPVLLARVANRMRPAPKNLSTSDSDIVCRRWLLIDCDAVRPSGISAIEEEHNLAIEKAKEIKNGLKSLGWPEPVLLDSGNGAQLMYCIDLPTDDNGLVQSCLKALASAGNDKVQVDQSVHNPARIWRLPGTMNRKGDEVSDRKHRMARILEAPEKFTIVSEEKLKALAGKIAQDTPTESQSTISTNNSFNLDDWISKYCPDARGPEKWKEGNRKWIFPVCPFNPEHDNSSAVITQQANGAIGFKCHHNGCINNDWHALRRLKKPDIPKAAPIFPDVDISGIMEQLVGEEKVKPWRTITNDNIMAILEGTYLGEMVKHFSIVTKPPLPLEASLIKSIVLAGCALSEKTQKTLSDMEKYLLMGARLARLRIDTAGGQVANAYAILGANSASGKDIGNLLDIIVNKYRWSVGTAGSAEGLADRLMMVNNGLIAISELANWLDKRHWQYKATPFLTESFNKGFFAHAFSMRNRTETRSTNYCYPNIIANIQPEVFEEIASKLDINSGFLGRFIYCKMPDFDGRPARFDIDKIIANLSSCVDVFRRKSGVVAVPEDYLNDIFLMFRRESSDKLQASWKRLVNEYGPRFAVMLSVTIDTRFSDEIIISDSTWEKAAVLTQWFYSHAEKMLSAIEDGNEFTKLREKLFKRIFRTIMRSGKSGARQADISRYAGYGSTSKEREEALKELSERGVIINVQGRYLVKSIPAGWE